MLPALIPAGASGRGRTWPPTCAAAPPQRQPPCHGKDQPARDCRREGRVATGRHVATGKLSNLASPLSGNGSAHTPAGAGGGSSRAPRSAAGPHHCASPEEGAAPTTAPGGGVCSPQSARCPSERAAEPISAALRGAPVTHRLICIAGPAPQPTSPELRICCSRCSEVCAPGGRVGSAQVGFVPLCSVIFVPPAASGEAQSLRAVYLRSTSVGQGSRKGGDWLCEGRELSCRDRSRV